MEKWKVIPNYETYSISSKGRVKNNKTGKILKPFLKEATDRKTYKRYRIVLKHDGKVTNFCVHKLVAESFVPNKKEYKRIFFKDQDSTNVAASNLKWISDTEYLKFWRSCLGEAHSMFYGNTPKKIKATNIITGNVIEFDSISECVKFFKSKYNFVNRVLKGVQKHHKNHHFELIKEKEECVSLGKRKMTEKRQHLQLQ